MKARVVNGLAITFDVIQAAFDGDVRHLVQLPL
jgi:hypothetical protein